MSSSRKNILDALTCDSSRDGCDGDWCQQVLDSAQSEDIRWVKEQLSSGKLEKEIDTSSR